MFGTRSKSGDKNSFSVFVTCDEVAGTITVCPRGTWSISGGLADTEALQKTYDGAVAGTRFRLLKFDCSGVKAYDSALVCYILKCLRFCREKNIETDLDSLPKDVLRLTKLARGVIESKSELHSRSNESDIFYRIGKHITELAGGAQKQLGFLGETVCAFGKFFRGKARYRGRDVLYFIQGCGIDALPIISLISFITGMILAYIGAMQLERFGAIIYVVSLIAIAMYREMGVIMTSVIMCGRTGSAFAAQIGSMQASEEISALRALGINPVEYLVLPRMIALTLMMPILTLYSDVLGLIGGFAVVSTMGVTAEQFWNQTVITMNLEHLFSGLIKSVFFGWLVAWAGCYRGMTAGRSSLDVGAAATSASVLGITLIVIGDGIFAVVFNILGF